MSSPRAIAAVTAAVRDLIESAVDGTAVTALPPDKARNGSGTQLNLYLYHAAPNAAWRNITSQRSAPSGDLAVRAVAPLALNLYYLLTVYGDTDRDLDAHRVLGEAMAVLHDQPVLDQDRIRAVSTGPLDGVGLDRQVDRVRLTFQPLSLDDTFKIWSGFQSPYRLSVAYEAAVVLIDTRLPEHHARPVLRRGPEDRGVLIQASMPPRLDSIRFPARFKTDRGSAAPSLIEIKEANEAAERLVLVGANLSGPAVTVQFRPLVGAGVIERPATAVSDGLEVALTPERPNPVPPGTLPWVPEKRVEDEPKWHPGFYTVTVVVDREPPKPFTRKTAAASITSNALVFPVAPRVVDVKVSPPGDVMTLSCQTEPQTLETQSVTAIIGHRFVKAAPRQNATDPIAFTFPHPPAERSGQPVLFRIRVDEVENLSMSVDAKTRVISFDQNQVKLS